MEMISLLSRWAHIGTAIVLVGGTVFMRFVLAPAAAQLSDSGQWLLQLSGRASSQAQGRWPLSCDDGNEDPARAGDLLLCLGADRAIQVV